MRRLLILLCLFSGLTPLFAQSFILVSPAKRTYTTSFPATENPIKQLGQPFVGGNWLNGSVNTGGTYKNCQTNGSMVYATASQVDFGSPVDVADNLAILGYGWRPDVTITATIVINSTSGSDGYELELLGHMLFGTNVRTGYEFNVNTKPFSGNYWGLVRLEGAPSSYTLLDSGTFGGGHTTGDTMKMVFLGNTISIYFNNSLLSSVTDAKYQIGAPGLGFDPYDVGNGPPTLTDAGLSQYQVVEN